MKKIEAVIKPHTLPDLKEELSNIGVQGLTVLEAGGFGRQRGHKEVFRGSDYDVDLLPKLMIILVTKDELVEAIVEKIISVCYTGKIGDGKIFISPVEETIRIRTKERGETAI